MESVKKAIRSALQKGDTSDRAFREKVYRQAFAALERSLQAREGLAIEELTRRREQLKGAIVDIEREVLAAIDAKNGGQTPATNGQTPTPATSSRPAEPFIDAPSGRREPDFSPRVDRRDRLDPVEVNEAAYVPAGERRTPSRRRGRRFPLIAFLLLVVLVVAIGFGLWRIIGGLPQSSPGGEAASPAQGAGDAAAPRLSGTGEERDWITIFSPSDPSSVSAPAGASAEAVDGGGNPFLRIVGEGRETAISFDIGQGVLERLAGRHVVLNLNARAEAGETQISISCDFGALGGCGRTRYVVGAQPSDYLLEIEVPDERVTGNGTISITPDIEGRGRALDVFSIRVSTAD